MNWGLSEGLGFMQRHCEARSNLCAIGLQHAGIKLAYLQAKFSGCFVPRNDAAANFSTNR
jgi:hypothetical protein